MREIIDRKFNEWASALNAEEARIRIFEEIRDIPYYLVPQIAEPYDWAASILETKKASCSPKHYLLGLLFVRLGIPIKYATYPFNWDKQPIRYPAELKKLAQGSPVGYHVACKAYLEGKWVLLDASWDSALSKAGFAVNVNWDGISDTVNSVVAPEEVLHDTLADRLNYVAKKRSLYTEEERATYAQFIEKFNSWLEQIRG